MNRLKNIGLVIDLAFFLDIILSFRTTYRHEETNVEIKDPVMIRKNYLRGMFWIDLLSTIPFDLIFYYIDQFIAKDIKTMGIIKIARITRISKLIAYMNSTDDVKVALNLFKTIL